MRALVKPEPEVDGGARPEGPDGPVRRRLYEGEAGAIGEFRCPARCRAWEIENRIGEMPTIAFARDPVAILRGGAPAVVATANEAMLYNAHEAYRRRLLDPNGDRCEFLLIRPRLLAEIVAAHDPRAVEEPERPLRWSSAPVSPRVYMAQRVLYHHVGAGDGIDRLAVDEGMITIADALVGAAAGTPGGRARRAGTERDHRVWVEGAKQYVARNFRRQFTLEEVAAAVGVSVFHLCRLFKGIAGTTVHDYVRSLRARAALEPLAERGSSIGRIAADMGFCNQSHFTRAFRHEFGATPSQVRRALRGGIAERELLDEPGPGSGSGAPG